MRVLLALLVLIAIAVPAQAAGTCGPRAEFIKALKDKYQESRTGMGVSGPASLAELYTSKAGTWTIIATRPDGLTCILAAGTGWEDLPPAIEEHEI